MERMSEDLVQDLQSENDETDSVPTACSVSLGGACDPEKTIRMQTAVCRQFDCRSVGHRVMARVFQSTRLGNYQSDLQDKVIALGARFSDERKLSDETTHVVVRSDQDLSDVTAKLLAALISGKRVVTMDYVSQSAEQGRWLDEEPFQPFAIHPEVYEVDIRRGILSKWRVVLYMSESKDKNQWTRILYSGGAQVFETAIRDEKDCFRLKGITHFVYREKEPLSDYLKNILLALEIAFIPVTEMLRLMTSKFVQRHLALPEPASPAAIDSSPDKDQSMILAIGYEPPSVIQPEEQSVAPLVIKKEEESIASETVHESDNSDNEMCVDKTSEATHEDSSSGNSSPTGSGGDVQMNCESGGSSVCPVRDDTSADLVDVETESDVSPPKMCQQVEDTDATAGTPAIFSGRDSESPEDRNVTPVFTLQFMSGDNSVNCDARSHLPSTPFVFGPNVVKDETSQCEADDSGYKSGDLCSPTHEQTVAQAADALPETDYEVLTASMQSEVCDQNSPTRDTKDNCGDASAFTLKTTSSEIRHDPPVDIEQESVVLNAQATTCVHETSATMPNEKNATPNSDTATQDEDKSAKDSKKRKCDEDNDSMSDPEIQEKKVKTDLLTGLSPDVVSLIMDFCSIHVPEHLLNTKSS